MELVDREYRQPGRKRFYLLPGECADKTAFMEPGGDRKGLVEKPVKQDPVFRLLMGVIIGMFIWNMVLASSLLQPFFGLVSGGWYFLLLLWFYAGTGRKYRWETVTFLIIGLICHFYWLWSVATPGLFSFSVVFGPEERLFSAMRRFMFWCSCSAGLSSRKMILRAHKEKGRPPCFITAGRAGGAHVDEAGTVGILSCSGTPVKVRIWLFWNWIM